jgi:hypothetical protein
MEPEPSPTREWEDVVELARVIDHGVASRHGVDAADVLRLARAVLAFHRRLASGSAVTQTTGPATGNGDADDVGVK